MDIIGHSQTAVTLNIYGHVMRAMQEEAAGHIDAVLRDGEDQVDVEARDERESADG
jgi:hypothetical protein